MWHHSGKWWLAHFSIWKALPFKALLPKRLKSINIGVFLDRQVLESVECTFLRLLIRHPKTSAPLRIILFAENRAVEQFSVKWLKIYLLSSFNRLLDPLCVLSRLEAYLWPLLPLMLSSPQEVSPTGLIISEDCVLEYFLFVTLLKSSGPVSWGLVVPIHNTHELRFVFEVLHRLLDRVAPVHERYPLNKFAYSNENAGCSRHSISRCSCAIQPAPPLKSSAI